MVLFLLCTISFDIRIRLKTNRHLCAIISFSPIYQLTADICYFKTTKYNAK